MRPLVEGAERLVEEQHGRLRRQRAGEPHALLLPARQLVDAPLGEAAQADQLEQLDHPQLAALARPPCHPQPERDVVAHVHVREQRQPLEHQPEAPLVRRSFDDRLRVEQHVTRVERVEARDQAQHRRFAAARRPEQRRDAAVSDLERDVVDGDHVGSEPAHEPAHAQRRHRAVLELADVAVAHALEQQQADGRDGHQHRRHRERLPEVGGARTAERREDRDR